MEEGLAKTHMDMKQANYTFFVSGSGPLLIHPHRTTVGNKLWGSVIIILVQQCAVTLIAAEFRHTGHGRAAVARLVLGSSSLALFTEQIY